jgi:hypothetical protein
LGEESFIIIIISIVSSLFENKSKLDFLSLLKGEQLGQIEATETFFAMTKLFQSKDVCCSLKKDMMRYI